MSSQAIPSAPDWLPTGQAAQQLGISASTLQRYRRLPGLLREGFHYQRGLYANTPVRWHVRRCFEAISRPAR